MDFGSLLYTAQKNGQKVKEAPARFYKTKFDPPKKVEKKQKTLSANIQKFLARKEEEEKQKLDEERKKKEGLLALRSQDKNSKRRVQSMLQRTKSANKAVIDDAKDDVNTAVTAAGPYQCDEDDYGYTSQEASSLYNKLLEKYSQMPAEENKFSKKIVSTKDLSSTRDRVRAQLQKEEEEKYLPHKRRRKDKDKENGNENSSDVEEKEEGKRKERDRNESDDRSSEKEKTKEKEKEKPKKIRRPMPPPMDFHELLKIAEQKQHEPVVVKKEAPAVKRQEHERLMTQKEKMEYEKERERRMRRDQRMAEMSKKEGGVKKPSSSEKSSHKETPDKSELEDLPVEERLKKDGKVWSSPSNLISDKNSNLARKKVMDREREIQARTLNTSRKSGPNEEDRKSGSLKSSSKTHVNNGSSGSFKRDLQFGRSEEKSSSILKNTLQRPMSDLKRGDASKNLSPKLDKSKSSDSYPKSREYPPKDIKSREFPPRDIKPREFPPRDLKPKEFPPRDLKPKRPFDDSRSRSSQLHKKSSKPVKRRIESDEDEDEDEDEYDSELDDFIDDDEYEDPDAVSNVISQIFRYDKSKYRNMDDDDDANMESSFSQVQREEFISAKIGKMEDDIEEQREKEMERRKKLRLKSLKQQKLTDMKKLKKR